MVNATIFAASKFDTPVAPKQSIINRIEQKFGREKAKQAIQELGLADTLEALTQREARYLLSFSDLDTLREKTAAQEVPGVGRLLRQAAGGSRVNEIESSFKEFTAPAQGVERFDIPATAIPAAGQCARVHTTGYIKGAGIMVQNVDAAGSLHATLEKDS